ncbi:hypothetical protein EJB05_56167 [Eragrostis curvula]|uniref:Uncharacterized protein n=1 Tax=Eragrostis curvula TaxID=38414 RepID=A0A5J9SHI6_9POAL|nr:hypothetical protein EJB05_56167 [Eragrostis curvula]
MDKHDMQPLVLNAPSRRHVSSRMLPLFVPVDISIADTSEDDMYHVWFALINWIQVPALRKAKTEVDSISDPPREEYTKFLQLKFVIKV